MLKKGGMEDTVAPVSETPLDLSDTAPADVSGGTATEAYAKNHAEIQRRQEVAQSDDQNPRCFERAAGAAEPAFGGAASKLFRQRTTPASTAGPSGDASERGGGAAMAATVSADPIVRAASRPSSRSIRSKS